MSSEPLRFHDLHGENLKLHNDGFMAVCTDSFEYSFCFSNRPLIPGDVIAIRVAAKIAEWAGFRRIGPTELDPTKLKDAVPFLSWSNIKDKSDFSLYSIPEKHVTENNIPYLFHSSNGDLMLKVNFEEPIFFISRMKTLSPLLGLFGVYGNTIVIELVHEVC